VSKSAQTTALVFGSSSELDSALSRAGIVGLVGGVADPGEADIAVVRAAGTLAATVASHLRELRGAHPDLPAVLVCAEVRPGETRQALAAGASGVVLEGALGATLAACIAAALGGQVCVPRRQARQVEPATLSAREKQILGMVVMGYMNGEIAERLFVAESTVKSHLSSAFGKLDVRSRNEAVELILDGERGLGIGILGLEGEPIAS
jgi:DNA-binding NarL/FixJ family response regulator